MKCAIGISSFLKEISSFLILLFSSISLHWLLRKSFLSLLAILWNSAFKWVYLYFSPLTLSSLLLTAIYKVSSDNHFACGDDGIPIELFLILKDGAVKVLYSICQQIWKTQQWPQDWKTVSFHSNPKQRQCQRMFKLPHNCIHLTQ